MGDAEQGFTQGFFYILIGSRILPSLVRIQSALTLTAISKGSADYAFRIMDIAGLTSESEINDGGILKSQHSKNQNYTITGTDIRYKYSSDSAFELKAKEFQITKGDRITILGQSGSGKTTFLDLLLGLNKPITGNLMIDDVDFYQYLKGHKFRIGYVPQENIVYTGSLGANVLNTYTGTASQREKILGVLNIAQLSEFIDQSGGIDSIVEDNGGNLSGGQRQRLAIARALIRDPDLLVFDEATSALDEKTESNLLKAVIESYPDLTIVIVSHRTSSLQYSTHLFSINNGSLSVEVLN
jgi:ABC-type bacteriocin/lantibiotic exporter with double-glycine peptidase domain